MKIIKTLKENNEFKVEFECSGEQWEKAFKKEYDSATKQVKVEGFRPGKAPANIVKKYINNEEVAYRTVYKLSKDIIDFVEKNKEFLKEKSELLEKPSLDILKFSEKESIITLTYNFYPVVKNELDYKKINLYETKPEEVSDKDVEEEINLYKSQNSKLVESKDTELKEGQTAIFDFTGFLDGEEFPGGKAENYELEIGSKQFIPGFEEQMIGMSIGSEKDINVKFPEDYHEKSLANKDVVFKIKLHSIKEKSSSELDDESIKDLKIPGVTNLKELKEFIKNSLLESIKTSNKELVLKSSIDHLIDKTEFTQIHENIIQYELDEYMKSLEQYWNSRGISLEQLLKMSNRNLKEFKESQLKTVINKINTDAIIKYIANKEKIEVSEKDYENEIKKLAKQYNVDEKIVKERLDSEKTKIMKELLTEKVIDKLYELNKDNERIKYEDKNDHHHNDDCDCGHEH